MVETLSNASPRRALEMLRWLDRILQDSVNAGAGNRHPEPTNRPPKRAGFAANRFDSSVAITRNSRISEGSGVRPRLQNIARRRPTPHEGQRITAGRAD